MCNAEATATAVTTVWAGGHADDRPLEGRLRRRRRRPCPGDLPRRK